MKNLNNNNNIIADEILQIHYSRINKENGEILGFQPTKWYKEDVSYDLASSETTKESLRPGETKTIDTNLTFFLPKNVIGLILPRSGLSAKCNLQIVNSPGLIDPGYTGSIKIILKNLNDHVFEIHSGMRIAQIIFIKIPKIHLIDSDEKNVAPGDQKYWIEDNIELENHKLERENIKRETRGIGSTGVFYTSQHDEEPGEFDNLEQIMKYNKDILNEH